MLLTAVTSQQRCCVLNKSKTGVLFSDGKAAAAGRISKKCNKKHEEQSRVFRSKRCAVFVCSRRLDGASVEVCEINLGGFGVDELCFHWALHRVVKV